MTSLLPTPPPLSSSVYSLLELAAAKPVHAPPAFLLLALVLVLVLLLVGPFAAATIETNDGASIT